MSIDLGSAAVSTTISSANYVLLARLRDDARSDLIQAHFRWGVPKELLERIAHMTPEQLLELVNGLGDQAVFVLRADFGTLVDLPPGLSRVYAASVTRRPLGKPTLRTSPPSV
jgi:hypothetical protein